MIRMYFYVALALQEQSQPLRDALKGWLDKQINDHLVEPTTRWAKPLGTCKRTGKR
jgi:hypothetical protein